MNGSSDTPLQADMRAALGFDQPERPNDLGLKQRMKDLLLDDLGEEIADLISGRDRNRPLLVDRIDLADVLACERRFVETSDVPFRYTPQNARGRVAALMLRRWYFRDQRTIRPGDWKPIEAVHEVLDELADQDDKFGEFIGSLSSGGRADVAAGVLDVVHAFEECWPVGMIRGPVRAYSALRTTLLNGRLVLTYRIGFKFGQPRSHDGSVMSSVVLFDIRPGREHEEEERYSRWFAALLELFQVGVAPSRVATWYAESQQAVGEAIDDAKLAAATRRLAAGIRRLVELGAGRTPTVSPGWRCNYCPLVGSCEVGDRWLSGR